MTKRKHEKRVLNCLPSTKTEKDWRFQDAADAGVLTVVSALPKSKDLRAAWWKIGNQEATGSCVGWATADSVVRWHMVKAGRLAKNDLLSVRYTWMAAKETDEFVNRPTSFIEEDGTSLKAALDVARKYGVVPDTLLPFDSGKLYAGEINVFYATAAMFKVGSYFNLGRDLRQWRTWIAANGPILTRLDVDETWDNAKATKGKLAEYKPDTVRGGHAVALVGYTPTSFIVRNSWGTTDWGDKGFGYASLEYAATAFTEAYGVSL
jgi:hypothetical protein